MPPRSVAIPSAPAPGYKMVLPYSGVHSLPENTVVTIDCYAILWGCFNRTFFFFYWKAPDPESPYTASSRFVFHEGFHGKLLATRRHPPF